MEQSLKAPLNVIGPRVRGLREAAGLTQDQLAARCQRLGLDVTRGTLAKMEAAVRTVSDHEIPFLARALKVPLAELFPPEPKLIPIVRKARNPNGTRRPKQDTSSNSPPEPVRND